MTRGRQGTGVQTRTSDYRVRFTWNGVRYEIPIDLKPSVPTTKHLERLMVDVRRAIAQGDFSFERFFPASDQAKAARISPPAIKQETFGDRADTWKRTRGAPLSKWQQKKDTLYVKFWKEKIGADTVMVRILPSELEAIVAEHAWPSAKHRNNLLTSLRGICELWVKDDRRNRVSPAADIVNGKVQKAGPDPFDMSEAELIINAMQERYGVAIAAYYEFAFFSGLRPEEQIALQWPKIDGRHHQVRVDVARTAREEKPIKNYELRDVDLNQRAWAALERMRPLTQLKPHGHVFENPRTGKPWASEADQRDLYWTPTLAKLRLRHRRAYQTRATCATMYLMMGKEPGWIAQQLGHSERVFWEAYAKTIKLLRRKDEMKDFEAKLAALKERERAA